MSIYYFTIQFNLPIEHYVYNHDVIVFEFYLTNFKNIDFPNQRSHQSDSFYTH